MKISDAFAEWNKSAGSHRTPLDIFCAGHAAGIQAAVYPALSHPTIHLRYYEWLAALAHDQKDFIAKMMADNNPNGLLMWAWSVSRESARRELVGNA